MLYFKFLFSLALHVIYIHAGFIPGGLYNGLQGHLDRLDGQCHGRNVPQKSFFQGVRTESSKIIISNYTFIVEKGGFQKILVTITIERCRFKENLDSCEPYFKQPNINYCKAIDPDNFISRRSPFFVPFEPPVKCPTPKGVYQAYNVTIDLSPFIFFKLDGWYWKARFEQYSEHNTLVFCMLFEGYFTKSNSKTK